MFETILKYNASNLRNTANRTRYYDSLFVTAHLLAYNQGQVPRFVYDKAVEDSKSFYIDPILIEFQNGEFRNDDNSIRPWHAAYVEKLGGEFQDVLSKYGTIDLEKADQEEIQDIANALTEFQENFIQKKVEELGSKYEELEEVQPEAVLTWRNRVTGPSESDKIREAIEKFRNTSTLPVHPIVQIPKNQLGKQDTLDSIKEKLVRNNVTAVFIAIENLRKRNTDGTDYSSTVNFIHSLAEEGIDPKILHGDFFANLLHYFGLKGTVYGPIYSDYTKPSTTTSTGKGGMLPRYYVSQIKDNLQVPAAVGLMQRAEEPMCECEFCERHFEGWDDLLDKFRDDKENLMTILYNHAFVKRWDDARLVEENEFEDIIHHLQETIERFSDPYKQTEQIAPDKQINYLAVWLNTLSDNKDLIQ